ncbi:hypothetical protein [Gordonia malaquae]|uniref:hypothetical protein n=1 Tax=Gordonia malaquae TaxID=410332 RepID=UPI003016EF4E
MSDSVTTLSIAEDVAARIGGAPEIRNDDNYGTASVVRINGGERWAAIGRVAGGFDVVTGSSTSPNKTVGPVSVNEATDIAVRHLS